MDHVHYIGAFVYDIIENLVLIELHVFNRRGSSEKSMMMSEVWTRVWKYTCNRVSCKRIETTF